jgi:hypothetical protein
MISFDLRCGNDHGFEGWFASSADFAAQSAGGLLSCPVCNDPSVRKTLSVPNVARKGNQQSMRPLADTTAPVKSISGEVLNAPSLPPAMGELLQKLATAQTEMLKTSDWVGREFAETARAIHYGEEADRLIHGETSGDEAQALAEEGINIAPLPFRVIPPLAKN